MNAIILAAGMSSRLVPLSYEKPKGLLKVKGEVLVERQIRQLQEAGVADITLVVGYKREMFSYLAGKLGVSIVVNEDYYRYNNTSSLIRVADRLDETYICSSDNYFTENVFMGHPSSAYYAAAYAQGDTDEYCLTVDGEDVITDVAIGGHDAWYMCGHAYFSHDFSAAFRKLLRSEYGKERTRLQYWEDLYIRNIRSLKMRVRRYPPGVIREFDTLSDLRQFDEKYRCRSGSWVLQDICGQLGCEECDIIAVRPVPDAKAPYSFAFELARENRGEPYLYRMESMTETGELLRLR